MPQACGATTIYLARHGQSEWNNLGRVTGQLDIGLSAKGAQQSHALAQCLREVRLDAIYASRLRRTLATAGPAAALMGIPIDPLAAFDEIHMGILQGRYRDERDPEAQSLWAQWQADLWGFRVPGGEGMAEFARRVDAACQALLQRHRGERILIVGHRATNRVLMGTLLGWPRERWGEIGLRNKYFYRVALAPDGDTPAVIDTFVLSGSKTGQCLPGFVM